MLIFKRLELKVSYNIQHRIYNIRLTIYFSSYVICTGNFKVYMFHMMQQAYRCKDRIIALVTLHTIYVKEIRYVIIEGILNIIKFVLATNLKIDTTYINTQW